ncbi:hypothetical protein PNK_1410 [Candidatus Protochlamydia naegleriophila]|uniref:Uncharacterized protein n=2 Tax=Candidatus Protochlamydia naegleriophila TaxID=389348 RepID=A0A0U5JF62_9BACT|nr:hypothetical protein PNK_1410 [Candidatus Protochlamydia naegleriophila]
MELSRPIDKTPEGAFGMAERAILLVYITMEGLMSSNLTIGASAQIFASTSISDGSHPFFQYDSQTVDKLKAELRLLSKQALQGIAIAKQEGVDISEQVNNMSYLIQDKLTGSSQGLEVKYRHQITMRERYCRQIMEKICKKKFMKTDQNAVSLLKSRLKRLECLASKYISLANGRDIDIAEPTVNMIMSISSSPSANELHQLQEIRYLHLVKVLEKYCSEICTRINRSYFTKVNQSVTSDLKWDLQLLVITTGEYTKIANKEGVDIQSQIKNIIATILNAPSFDDPHQSKELIYRQQLLLRSAYCSQIIRKVTEHRIRRTADAARNMPELAKQVEWITTCEKWLLDRLPKEELPLVQHPEVVKIECQWLESKLEGMMKKILAKARVSTPLNIVFK